MSCLHRSGTATAQHDKPLLGEPLAQQGNFAVGLVGPEQGMTAHDAHAATMVVGLEKPCQRRVNTVVVQGARQQLLHVVGVLPH